MLKTSELFALHAWCRTRAVWFVSDEIYHQIEYGEERATSALESPGAGETALVINSFSKYHCMTGWRVGWCVAGGLSIIVRHSFGVLHSTRRELTTISPRVMNRINRCPGSGEMGGASTSPSSYGDVDDCFFSISTPPRVP